MWLPEDELMPGGHNESEMTDRDGRRHLHEDELALRWRVSTRTLQRWRHAGLGPAYLRLGRRIIYRRVDVAAFEARRLVTGETAP